MSGRVDEPSGGAQQLFAPRPMPGTSVGALAPPDLRTGRRRPRPEPELTPAKEPVRKRRRTWGQRAVIAFNSMVALACFVAAVAIWYGNDQLGRRKQVDISSSGAATTVTTVAAAAGGGTGSGGVAGGAGEEISSNTFPVTVDAEAKNFLLTGSDNRACIDPNSPYAGAFLGTESGEFGERSDTIMILRVDPATNQAAVLSFPRDLWVSIAGSNRKSRINAAFDTENPTKLIDTIWDNFEVPIDHYINVDFCAFKGVVDAVGGVAVPFEFAARDKNTGLNIGGPECHVFEGDEALAYVRSRHYQWFNPETNKWVTDRTSDYGRITRQQDFLKRAFAKAIDRGARNPLVAQELLNTMKDNVTTDTQLTLNVMLQLAGAMQNFDPETVSTFQIEGRGVTKGNAAVIEPSLNTDTMKAVLAVFRGQARLADAPTATTPGDVATTLPTSTPAGSTSTTTPDVAGPASTSTTIATSPDDSTTETTVVLTVDDMSKGFYPPDDPSCH